MSRKQSREVAFKLLFALSFSRDLITEQELATDERIDEKEQEYINKTVSCVRDNLSHIDAIISGAARDFSFDRIFKVDLTALRLAIAEMMILKETPTVVAINEAVNLVKKYGTEKSGKYVNGILATVANG